MGAHGRMFARAKGKQQKKFWQLQCLEQCIDHIPYYLSRSSTTFLEIAVNILIFAQKNAEIFKIIFFFSL